MSNGVRPLGQGIDCSESIVNSAWSKAGTKAATECNNWFRAGAGHQLRRINEFRGRLSPVRPQAGFSQWVCIGYPLMFCYFGSGFSRN